MKRARTDDTTAPRGYGTEDFGVDSSDSEPEEELGARAAAGHRGNPDGYGSWKKSSMSRRDKHAPAEVSSKRRPPMLQNVIDVPKVIRRGAHCGLQIVLGTCGLNHRHPCAVPVRRAV